MTPLTGTGGRDPVLCAPVAGTDCTAVTNQVLTFGPGVMSLPVTVTLLDDGGLSANKSLSLTLGNPGNGTTLGTQTTALLWIVD